MTSRVEERLLGMGMSLPEASVPPAVYSPVHVHEGLVTVSGQPPYWNGTVRHFGKLGRELGLEEGMESARISTLNILAHLKRACGGDLDRVVGCVHMLVLVQATPDFYDIHKVADGASGLIRDVFAPLPPPTRSSLGCASLPLNAATEVEASFIISE